MSTAAPTMATSRTPAGSPSRGQRAVGHRRIRGWDNMLNAGKPEYLVRDRTGTRYVVTRPLGWSATGTKLDRMMNAGRPEFVIREVRP